MSKPNRQPDGQWSRSLKVISPFICHCYHTQNQLKGGKELDGDALCCSHIVELQKTNNNN